MANSYSFEEALNAVQSGNSLSDKCDILTIVSGKNLMKVTPLSIPSR
jgi:hypothetical protein